jgi:hypothetical protein
MTYEVDGETFEWDRRTESWLWGTPTNGIGVFKQFGHWWGNIILRDSIVPRDSGPYETAELAMIDSLKKWRT